MKLPHILVVGSVNVDMVVKSPHLPAPGQTVTGGQFMMAPGGKGANQAVAAARLGGKVTLVACVGDDAFGRQAIKTFRREGIHTQAVARRRSHPTGIAMILVDEGGENLISVASGANAAWNHTPTFTRQMRNLIRSADMVMLQLEIPLKTVVAVAEIAARAGVPVILNPAPAGPLATLPESTQRSLLRHVTYLTPNEIEAGQLSGIAVTDEQTARTAARRLLAMGGKVVIVTMGAVGALLADGQTSELIPAPCVHAVDTTAAGDAFNGALAVALARGDVSMAAAVREACLVGALCATRLGAQPSLPTQRQVKRYRAMQTP
ncbi:MAG: ribokinase [Phycisphaerae bacterium]|nr:ribokinase [Phycisphaerae bacterium]